MRSIFNVDICARLPQSLGNSGLKVVLFDIDGTLISKQSTEATERERFRRGVADEVGRSLPTEPWLYDGMVDPEICRRLLLKAGLSAESIPKLLQRVILRVETVYLKMEKKPVLNHSVDELLGILSASSDHMLGVLTGNLRAVAEEKLRLTGIRGYFGDVFCSNGYLSRDDLVRDAVRDCVGRHGLREKNSVVIVGDTPRDMEAARKNEAKAIGVATGFYTMGELQRAGAAVVFRSLEPSNELFEAFGL